MYYRLWSLVAWISVSNYPLLGWLTDSYLLEQIWQQLSVWSSLMTALTASYLLIKSILKTAKCIINQHFLISNLPSPISKWAFYPCPGRIGCMEIYWLGCKTVRRAIRVKIPAQSRNLLQDSCTTNDPTLKHPFWVSGQFPPDISPEWIGPYKHK